MNNNYTEISVCRLCASPRIAEILDLGPQPLANSLHDRSQRQERFPLSTVFCLDCGLFQLKQTVKKEILFDHYVWMTQTSEVIKKYAPLFCERLMSAGHVNPGDLVVEIASNDGTLLKPFLEKKCKVVGVDPAQNIAQLAQGDGVETLVRYWGQEAALDLKSHYGVPKVLFARNVIPHVSELHDVMQGISLCLDEESVGAIEFHDAGVILRDLHYDSIYHEHLCYFTLKTMECLLQKFDLNPFDLLDSPISGGSYVVYFSKKKRSSSPRYLDALAKEEKTGTNTCEAWQEFAKRSCAHKKETLHLLSRFKDKIIVGFGASARSSTYLNYCRLDQKTIKMIIDNNPLKQGLLSPGSDIPIVTFEVGMRQKPDLIFLLAWNFKEEIIQSCREKGYEGDYLIPFPQKPQLVNKHYFLINRR